uniref:Dynein regulatory complex subunit 3 n=1 Tax=Zooxanthella nutricula TaxID=1333877 RepID=A0A7S2HKM0_9DINO
MEQQRKKTDVVEPQVISEELLIEGVEEPQRPDGEPWEPIDFPKVTSLRLCFQNIIEVSNLNNFDSLTTLRLDNNIIDKMCNLSHLKRLTWLDLSFNNIREIEGLHDLHSLQDLSLYHNQIEEIRGLDGCPNLNILSLGHNNIKELKQIDNLRKFQNLRCVCLEGNKVCNNDSYNQHVLAYLPHLKYLDYMLIDRKAVTQAQEGYNLDELTEVKEREQAEQAKLKARKEKEAIIEKLKGAFLDCTEDLFEELFARGVEPENVTVLTCYPQLKEDYRERLAEDVKNLRGWMEGKNDGRVKKAAAFEKAVTVAENESEDETFQMVRDFRSHKKKVLAQIDREGDSGLKPEMEAMIQQLLEQLQGLENHLLANEVQLQESIYEAISDFEAKISEIVKVMSEKAGEFFRHLEDLEKVFYTGLMEGSNSEIESFSQNQDISTQDSDMNKARFLTNKDEMVQACVNFNEAHMSLIQNKEDYMSNQMSNWRNQFFERHRERQYHRNRQRVMDIKKVVDDCRAEIAAASEIGDEFDDGDNGGAF